MILFHQLNLFSVAVRLPADRLPGRDLGKSFIRLCSSPRKLRSYGASEIWL